MPVLMPQKTSHWMLLCGKQAAVEHAVLVGDEYDFLIAPTEWMRYAFQWDENKLLDGRMRIKFKRDYCYDLDPSPHSSFWLILCDQNGNPDRGLISFLKAELIERNLGLVRENNEIRGQILRQHFDNMNRTEFPAQFEDAYIKRVERVKRAVQSSSIEQQNQQ